MTIRDAQPDPAFLREDIRYLPGIGARRAETFANAYGVKTVRDLLHFYPRRYLDRSTVAPIRSLRESADSVTVVGTVRALGEVSGRSKKRYEIILEDSGGGRIKGVWFQGIYWIKRVFEKGDEVAFHGKVQKYGSTLSMTHPDFDKLSDGEANLDTGRIVPLYRGGQAMSKVGLTSRSIRKIIYQLFKEHGLKIPEVMPDWLTDEYDLLDGRVALRAIHLPKNMAELRRAKRRLKFEEFFYIQLLLAVKKMQQEELAGPPFSGIGELTRTFLDEVIPFTLTGAQRLVLREISQDVQSGIQMNRLLQGDVGSGKTVVAVTAMLFALDSGYQSAFMAPTEILAEQHFTRIKKYVEPLGIKPKLLVGAQGSAERESSLEALRSGASAIAVGTHAVIQEEVLFNKLGLAIVDEQHRFGVMQRAEMFSKGENPHMLLMTATPIPRSLALTLYGDLDVSIMDEMPAGRIPVKTRLLYEKQREQMYEFVREQLSAGNRAFVVYPLVEESEKLDLRDAEGGYQKLKKVFSEFEVDLVHGRMSSDEKDEAMRRFKSGASQVLVSTTVIEVGVDVAEATVMVIEHAERFGLSQLHQLRGRVGRSDEQSYCLLMAGFKQSAEAKERLRAMVETTDGFEISERDLEIRGAGDFFGTRQSGMPDLHIADVTEDADILTEAREAAFALIKRDPDLAADEHDLLRDYFERYFARKKFGFLRVG